MSCVHYLLKADVNVFLLKINDEVIMYLSLNVSVHECIFVHMHVFACMNVCTHICMHKTYMQASMYVMYVRICVFIHVYN